MADDAELRLGTDASCLGALFPWLDAQCAAHAVSEPQRHAMHVAIEEAAMNVVMHAGATGMWIRFSADPDALTLMLEDDGRTFDPATAPMPPRPNDVAEASPGGRGLRLLRHYCRDLAYTRANGRNLLTMRFPRRSG